MSAEIEPEEVLRFWFEEAGKKRWFAVDPKFDARVRRRFAPLVFKLSERSSVADHPWLDGPDGALALILALDQFPRNIWRGTAKAFSLDPLALQAARIALESGFDAKAEEARRAFFYMPFMHSENLEDQQLCVSLAETRLPKSDTTARHARAHRRLIERFGRFPHRNAALDRASSASEVAFLTAGGYAPGRPDPANSA